MTTKERVEGTVHCNDGWFAELLTYGAEGIDKAIASETFQIYREDTADQPEEFQRRFPIGAPLSILTITEIAVLSRKE
jgi:hypothetical protein